MKYNVGDKVIDSDAPSDTTIIYSVISIGPEEGFYTLGRRNRTYTNIHESRFKLKEAAKAPCNFLAFFD